MSSKKRVSILGATGSVGKSTIDLVLSQADHFDVQAITCNRNTALLAEQAVKLRAKRAVAADEASYNDLKERLADTGIEVTAGPDAVIEAALMPADWIMAAIVGVAGLEPVMAAVSQGNVVAIANKEPLVAAGRFVREAAKLSGATLLPVDSEHNAIFQVFDKNNRDSINKILLTASGGPFLKTPLAELEFVTPDQAVKHPNWSMGAKISVDSATMMNKALEIIEAHYLFDLEPHEIDVVIHPQSVIHSFVSYNDGSVLAQLGAPDMRTPIAYALAWPQRMATTGDTLDLNKALTLDLLPPDQKRFPALRLAYAALEAGEATCVAMNAANEIAVNAFLKGKIKFSGIVSTVETVIMAENFPEPDSIKAVIELDRAVRKKTKDYITSTSDLKPRAA